MKVARFVAFVGTGVVIACTSGCSSSPDTLAPGDDAGGPVVGLDGASTPDTSLPGPDAATSDDGATPGPDSAGDDSAAPASDAATDSSSEDSGIDASSPDGGADAATDSAADAATDSAADAGPLDAGCQTSDGAPCTDTLTVVHAGSGYGEVTSAPAGIACYSTCSASFASGTSVTLTPLPESNSTFTGWSAGPCSGTGTCVVNVNAATSVTATFTIDQYALTVTPAGNGSGTVSSTPAGISCAAAAGVGTGTCSAKYNDYTNVTLTAAATAGSVFTGWAGSGCTGTSPTCVVDVQAATSVTPTFKLGVALDVTSSGGTVTSVPSGVNCGVTCAAAYSSGTPVTLTAAPLAGWAFTGWSAAGCPGTGTCVVNVTTATSVTAKYQVTSTVWDPTWSLPGVSYTNGDLSIAQTATSTTNTRTNVGMSAGLWYWEITATAGIAANDEGGLGIVNALSPNNTAWVGNAASGLGFGYGTGNNTWWLNWSGTTISAAKPPASCPIAAGNVYQFALDMSSGSFWVGEGGTWWNGGDPATNTAPVLAGITGTVYPAVTFYGSSINTFTANFGASAFKYPAPTGYVPGIYPAVYGYPNLACTAGSLAKNVLAGEAISVSTPMTATALAVTVNAAAAGNDAVVALYDNTGTAGAPGHLVASTASTPLAAGANLIAVTPTALAAGTYWIMAVYNFAPSVCVGAATTTEDFTALTYGTALPTTFPSSPGTQPFNVSGYYVVGH